MPAGLPALPTRVLGPRITKYNAALENSLYLSTHQRVGGARTGARPRARRELGWLEGGHAEEPAAAHAAVRDGARLRGLGAPEAHHHAPAREHGPHACVQSGSRDPVAASAALPISVVISSSGCAPCCTWNVAVWPPAPLSS